MLLSRRNLLSILLAAPVLPLLDADWFGAQKGGNRIEPTPACGDDDSVTPAQEEGPFFKAGAPDRHQLVEEGSSGELITVAGMVVDTSCRPIPGALVQIWHADNQGDYDHVAHRFRGVHRTNAEGRWWFSTIVPALYPGRTRHYHFKVQPPERPSLTTQLFFPGDPRNASDGLFDKRLVLHMTRTTDGQFGRYDFVV